MNNSTEEQISNVWLSTDAYWRNAWRFLKFNDSGSLLLSGTEMRFYGNYGERTIRKITNLDLTHTNFPWGSFFLSIVVAAILLGSVFYFDSLEGMKNPLFVFLIVLLISVILQKTTLWVKIVYQDESSNTPRVIYFSDGSLLGWGGVLGGTLSLYRRIKAFYSERAG